jgi:hypothetical protein
MMPGRSLPSAVVLSRRQKSMRALPSRWRCRSVAEQKTRVSTNGIGLRSTAVKVLVYDGQAFWLCHKRLSSGRFRWWPASGTGVAKALESHQLQVLLSAGVKKFFLTRMALPSDGEARRVTGRAGEISCLAPRMWIQF